MNAQLNMQINTAKIRLGVVIVSTLALFSCGEDVLPSEENQAPDPVVVDVPVAFIKRDLTVVNEDNMASVRDLSRPAQFVPGSALYIKSRASTSAEERNLTDSLFIPADVEDPTAVEIAPYDVKDLSASYDGTRLIFALRAPETEENPDPTWDIYEYSRETDEIRRVISSDIVANAGDDTGPVYLPDGRILFSSTRQRANQAILLDEGKPQYAGLEEGLDVQASVLHVMNSDGSEIQQISFNQSHDLDPIVAPNGKVVFSRWDQAVGDKGVHLYQMNSDGSDLEILYGRHSHNQGGREVQFTQTRITPDERMLVALTEFEPERLGGDFTIVDAQGFSDLDVPTIGNPGGSGAAQTQALFDNVDASAEFSLGGLFGTLYPLWDGTGRYIYTWSQCRALEPLPEGSAEGTPQRVVPCSEEIIADPAYSPAPPLFGLWFYDPNDNTQLPLTVPEENVAYMEVVAMESRPFPANPELPELIPELVDENLGVVHIRSIYDFAGSDASAQGIDAMANPTLVPINGRAERFLRVIKSVSIPNEDTLEFDNSAFGRSRANLMREVLGYTPIQPDGSVMVTVPANVPFAITILDENGRRISPQHNNWLQVIPGEVKTCNGCHTNGSTAPHGRMEAEAASINLGAPTNGGAFPGANPAMFTDIGETMAQTYARVLGLPRLTPDLVFADVWSDPATTPLAPAINVQYADMGTPLPISQACAQNWTSLCRIEINYPEHIQPIFERVRQTLDSDGMLLTDNTCVSCHTNTDAEGMTQVPAGQLELTAQASLDDPDVMTSYRELFFGDNAQELVEGVLVDILELVFDENGDPVFLRDEDGELILDPNGNPIQLTETVPVQSTMRVRGAVASDRFFEIFNNPESSHYLWLEPVEQKLIAEWLDVGAQYYNNPFAIPQN
ncbi:hypothetical protein QTP81_15555 [Alteromonas sp. ASW11-36]|uniref:Hydrazine synthase alpha subunit middle domain-containing protein n=1 Tax=Alteromonas arenosi TaxID=3055817 RepID=A0ABT7T2N6_9ALTE|nr:hypothetical protein [Alteromonas sp. ASW11-36]MDM7862019.1 hypothetical protein [Alteromonas sp. ASW11-36]